MRNYLSEYMLAEGYPSVAQNALLRCYDAFRASALGLSFFKAVADYEADAAVDYEATLDAIGAAATKLAQHPYTAKLLFFLCLTRHARVLYERRGLSRELFEATMADLGYKMYECMDVYGVVGSFAAEYFVRFFQLERFMLGRLHFEIEPLRCAYRKNGISLEKGTPVINLHIPRTGEPLEYAAFLDACRRAEAFFADEHLPTTAFVCCSWLLYPANKDMLSPTSRIRRFMASFDILEVRDDPSHENLWRLFDCRYDGDPDRLPADSSLRRAYIAHLKAGRPTGEAYGIYIPGITGEK